MSSEVNIRESPNHFIVLDSISRGMNRIDKISRVSKLSKPEVESIVNDLVFQRLARGSEKKGFFGRKKIELKITETGESLLETKKNELQEKVRKMEHYYKNGNKSQLDSFMASNRAWMPMMLFTGIMDMMFFTSMMSLLGLALNPMENSLAHSVVNPENGAGYDSHDTGSDGGGFDGGGFDGGGFDF